MTCSIRVALLASISASANTINKGEVNESGCEVLGAIQDVVLYKLTHSDTAGEASFLRSLSGQPFGRHKI